MPTEDKTPLPEIIALTPTESQLIGPIIAELDRLQQLAGIAAGAMVASRELPGTWKVITGSNGQLALAQIKEGTN